MALIIVKFSIKGTQYTWFVNQNWIPVTCFFLTMGLGLLYRNFVLRKKTPKPLPNPRGGEGSFFERTFDGFIDLCVEPENAYEIVHSGLNLIA